ncbi:hypothetical protein HMPREF0658_2173 [Hoylesella marshii DSM 16973 = JCM 13450]|uniref:Uncharacterized protein n=1 Tax=Hoylesella marshii DSM 16973 = JCM 13450 TaxID=862515 RepID=E0NVG8_9BACT|nr:hypothetical protein HMPREF0658_2173 [Hoylesella marshii DSM 16973 = JCM 13450]
MRDLLCPQVVSRSGGLLAVFPIVVIEVVGLGQNFVLANGVRCDTSLLIMHMEMK